MNVKRQEFCVKRILILGYLFYPLLVYVVPVFLSYDVGHMTVYFFKSHKIYLSDALTIFLGYALLGGFLIFFVFLGETKIYSRKANSTFYDVFIFLVFLGSIYFWISYLKVILGALFLVLIASYRPGTFGFLLLFLTALVSLIFFYDRYPVILILLIWTLPLSSVLSYKKLLLLGVFATLLMVFVLQPIRAGVNPLDFKVFGGIYLLKHFYPIYISSYLYFDVIIEKARVLAESFPLLKSLFGVESVINDIGKMALPQKVYDAGTRIGSNSTMYFNVFGAFLLASMLMSVFFLNRYFKLKFFRNAFLMLLIVQAPYFIRRAFGSLFVDIILILFISIIVGFIFQGLSKKN